MNDNKFLVDYYSTKKSNNGYEYDITDKFKVNAYSSDGTTLGDNIDIFLHRKDFPSSVRPNKHDMLFLLDKKKFYQVTKNYNDEVGDFFIVNVKPCKCN